VNDRQRADIGAWAPPFELVNAGGTAPVVLLCDHASNQIPQDLESLGLEATQLASHIAWDIGAAGVTRELSRRLDAPAVMSRISRLVVDANRRPGVACLIPEEADHIVVPGNLGLSEEDRDQRVAAYHRPYHQAIAETVERLAVRGPGPAVVSIHSFTPVMDGFERPWPIGILSNLDQRLPRRMISFLRDEGLLVGDNEPYSGDGIYGYTVQQHADPRGLTNVIVELRQDLVDTPHGVTEWADRLERALDALLDDPQMLQRVVAA
jgi:predicted N-formylglutamate amidohydrolase